MPSLSTFNANNFYLRYKFTNKYPGDSSNKSLVEAGSIGLAGYIPGLAFGQFTSRYIVWDANRRQLAVRALMEPDNLLPDILCFQEVENIAAIRVLNDRYLGRFYPYSLLIDSYDTRNIDVGILSRFPISRVESHIDEFYDQDKRIFSRDCLEADIELPTGETLSLFLNHLKSEFVKHEANESDANYNARVLVSHQKRERQAQWVADRIDQRFAGLHNQALYAVVGDFNDTDESPRVNSLIFSPHLTYVVGAHRPLDDRWTYYWKSRNKVSHIDYILASSEMANRVSNVVAQDPQKTPHIERQGIAFREISTVSGLVLPKESNLTFFEPDPVTAPVGTPTPSQKIDFRFPRYPEVIADWRANISDHCPVKVWF